MARLEIYHIFLLICSILTIIYCSKLICKYLSNESSTQIAVQELGNIPKAHVPAITVCLHADRGDLFLNMESNINISKEEYYFLLLGKGNDTSGILQQLSFQNSIIKGYDYLSTISWIYDADSEEQSSSGSTIPIFDTYLDPDDQCFTFESIYVTSVALNYVNFHFNTMQLQKLGRNGMLQVFLHHPGHLIRSSNQLQFFSARMQNMDTINNLEVHVHEIKLIRNRVDDGRKCNEDIKNEDTNWMKSVIELIGCVPEYWIGILKLNNVPLCNTRSQLRNAAKYHMMPFANHPSMIQPTIRKNNKILYSKAPPCIIAQISSESLQNTIPPHILSNDTFNVMVRFTTNRYTEMINVRDYPPESLFAEMGGYIGVFTGISIFQIMSSWLACIKWIRQYRLLR